ncbi:MAG: glycerophosphoryl diester phosphodiesterase membrane domain-containing protein [Caldilineaceae bacterium]|nr:glycerophosphoryl diester phosphodiesterase membrane domain-containing protein [Caldilineaceae bacterium]
MSAFPISGPLSLGDLLDRSFRLYRARFALFVGTAALFLVPLALVSGLLTGTFMTSYIDALGALSQSVEPPSEAMLIGLFDGALNSGVMLLLLSLVSVAVNGIVSLALTSQCIDALHGRRQPMGQSIALGWRRLWTFVRMSILEGLAAGAATLAVGLVLLVLFLLFIAAAGIFGLSLDSLDSPAGAVAAVGAVIVLICGYFLGIVLVIAPAVYLAARWIISVPVLVDGEWRAREALRRSWGLTEGNVWRSVGYSVLLFLVGALVISMPVAVFQAILTVLVPSGSQWVVATATTAFSSLFSVLWLPFNTGALVLLYYDLRVRKESYDLELRIDQMAAGLEDETPNAGGMGIAGAGEG